MKLIKDIHFLKQKSKEVRTDEEAKEIIKDLEDSLDLKQGIGLSAIQIGIGKQVSIIRMKDFKLDLINPKILDKDKRFRVSHEGCLSLPGLYIDTSRYYYITFENGLEPNRKKYAIEGIQAVCLQHEIHHQQGKLITDKDVKWRKRR